MPTYSESILEAVKSRLEISEVISPYVRLTKRGDRFWGLCPFHYSTRKTLSVIDGDDGGGFYKCVECGKGGGIFQFIMDIEHVDFSEAVRILARQAGVEKTEESEVAKKDQGVSIAMGDLYNSIGTFLHQYLLKSPVAKKAREYIRWRGITKGTCEKFQLGYIPPYPDWTYNLLKKQGYPDEIIQASGLVYKERENKGFFRDRIMFPIRAWQGNCVAFSGRDLSGYSGAPKYKNSSDSELYSKRKVLFGFYESMASMKMNHKIIICEGNFDVISLHQAGLDYACATCGTALTDDHLKMIKRYCDTVYLMFDSDSAGQMATCEALVKCRKAGLSGYVINLDGAKDASQMLMEKGADELRNCCSKPMVGFDYLLEKAIKENDITQPSGKVGVLKELIPLLDAVGSSQDLREYILQLSSMIRIGEEYVMADYLRLRNKKKL